MHAPFVEIDLPLEDRRDGKVRVSYAYGKGQRIFITTDRLSAFDRVIEGVPYKGQVLNQLSAWWFDRTADVVANHVIDVPDPATIGAHEWCDYYGVTVEEAPNDLEVVVVERAAFPRRLPPAPRSPCLPRPSIARWIA